MEFLNLLNSIGYPKEDAVICLCDSASCWKAIMLEGEHKWKSVFREVMKGFVGRH
jgi:hypothetical protein